MDSLESILSGDGKPSPENKSNEQQQVETQATPETPEPEEKPADNPEGDDADEGKTVPLKALHAEREKTKRYTEQVADFDKKLDEQNARWEQRLNKLVDSLRPKEQPPAPPDPFANPEQFVQQNVQTALDPIQKSLVANNRLVAEAVNGVEAVKSAVDAFDAMMAQGQLDPRDYQRVMNSPNQFHEAVLWHKRHQVLTEIGDDPVAYRERIKAEALAELNGGQQQQQPVQQQQVQRQQTVMPSNLAGARGTGSRSGPEWSGPTPLKDIFDRARK